MDAGVAGVGATAPAGSRCAAAAANRDDSSRNTVISLGLSIVSAPVRADRGRGVLGVVGLASICFLLRFTASMEAFNLRFRTARSSPGVIDADVSSLARDAVVEVGLRDESHGFFVGCIVYIIYLRRGPQG